VQELFTCGEVRHVIIKEATFSGNGPLSGLNPERSVTRGKALRVSPDDHEPASRRKVGHQQGRRDERPCRGAGQPLPGGVSGGGRSGRRFRHARSPAVRYRWIRSRACRWWLSRLSEGGYIRASVQVVSLFYAAPVRSCRNSLLRSGYVRSGSPARFAGNRLTDGVDPAS